MYKIDQTQDSSDLYAAKGNRLRLDMGCDRLIRNSALGRAEVGYPIR